MYLADNLVFLRQRRGLNQSEAASTMGISRTALISYEKGVMPNIDSAATLAKFFQVTIDALLYRQFSKLSARQLEQLFEGTNQDIVYRGHHLQAREVVHTVDQNNKELIDLVPIPATMGYAQGGFESEDFIAELPKFNLPLPCIKPGRQYRTFPTKGDSMLPIADGSYVMGEYVQDWFSVRNGSGYIFVLKNGDIVFKKAKNELAERHRFELHSLNPLYKPYYVPAEEIKEIWKYVMVMSDIFPDPEPSFDLIISELRHLRMGQDELLQRGQ